MYYDECSLALFVYTHTHAHSYQILLKNLPSIFTLSTLLQASECYEFISDELLFVYGAAEFKWIVHTSPVNIRNFGKSG